MNRLDADALSWTGLLAHWLDFARAAKAWPRDAQGDAWRGSVPAVINLQAVTFALAELVRVPEADRPFACDRAEVLIRAATATIEASWTDRLVPESLLDIIEAAHVALARAPWAGTEELVWSGREPLLVPSLPVDEPGGTLAVMQPGTIAMPGEPVAWWLHRDPAPIVSALPDCVREVVAVPRQVYRALDDAGNIRQDTIAPVDTDPLPGLPLLVPIWERGTRIGRFTLDAKAWEARQRAGLPEGGSVEVVEED